MNHPKMVPFKTNGKEVNLRTKQELEDRSSMRKLSVLSVSKADSQLIKATKYEIERIVQQDLVHFKEEHSEQS